jgi:hypothetical protein
MNGGMNAAYAVTVVLAGDTEKVHVQQPPTWEQMETGSGQSDRLAFL